MVVERSSLQRLRYTAVLLIVTAGCTTTNSVHTTNSENLTRLSVGMTKAQVLDVMGSSTVTAWHPFVMVPVYGWLLAPTLRETIPNPYRTEALRAADDATPVVILYYLVGGGRLMPLVLEDEELVGWGWTFIESRSDRYRITPPQSYRDAGRGTTVRLGSGPQRTDRREGPKTVYDADECIGPIVAGRCQGTILPKKSYHPKCHGEMLNGRCTGPMF